MFAEKHYPEVLLPEDLDAYLEKGWYRMGQTIFTTHFLSFGEQFYSAIWVRLSLEGYTFRKSLRKLFNKNMSRFKVVFGPARLTREKERLYHRYKLAFPGVLASNLREALMDGEEDTIYNTFETCIYDGNRLVGASFFDVGRRSVASIMGMYDPEYDKYSLGFFTMLLEIHFCQEQGIPFFYPGYVVPGYARFDYKLRIGDVDYYDLGNCQWKPYKTLPVEEIPLHKMHIKLEELCSQMAASGLPSRLLLYPLFEANLFSFWKAAYFDYPVLLHCFPANETATPYHLIAVFDVRQNAFLLFKCSRFEDIQFVINESFLEKFDHDRYFADLLVIDQLLLKTTEAADMAKALRSI